MKMNVKRKVVIALRGAARSGKTSSLRLLVKLLIKAGAVIVGRDKEGTQVERVKLFYRRWNVLVCVGGDNAAIIRDNFAAEKITDGQECDVVIMPAWKKPDANARTVDELNDTCAYALLSIIWTNAYSLEIVNRQRAPQGEKERWNETAKSLMARLEFVINDRFSIQS